MDTILRTQLENRLRAAIESGDQKAYRIALLDVQVALSRGGYKQS